MVVEYRNEVIINTGARRGDVRDTPNSQLLDDHVQFIGHFSDDVIVKNSNLDTLSVDVLNGIEESGRWTSQ